MRRQDRKRRFFLSVLGDWAVENGFAVQMLSEGWIALLTRGDLVLPVISYDIGLNSSAVHRIVNDKVATSAVLAAAGVAALEHRIVLHPELLGEGEDGLSGFLGHFAGFGGDAVVKPLDQSHGKDVRRVTSEVEARAVWEQMQRRYQRFCISPFVEIAREDRFYFLGERKLLSYGKRAGADFRGNLAAGGAVIFHDGSEGEAEALARAARAALGLRYGCVDVITLTSGARMVIEANSGVMLDEIVRIAGEAGVQMPFEETYRAGFAALLAERGGVPG